MKTKSMHTPGPWEVLSGLVCRNDGVVLAKMDRSETATKNGILPTERDANARLIAAAPELVMIAKAYRNLLKTWAHTEGEVATFHHIQDVLAKAGVE